MFGRKKESSGSEVKKSGAFSRFLGKTAETPAQANTRATPTPSNANTSYTSTPFDYKHNDVNDNPPILRLRESSLTPSISDTAISPLPPAPPPATTATQPPNATTEDDSFNLRVTKDLWPEFSPGEEAMQAVGQLFFDFTDSSQTRWARGEDTGTEYGTSIFPWKAPGVPPKRLFDLDTLQVVATTPTDRVPYTIISHAWGEVPFMIDGKQYGVDWQIPIRRKAKLDQILTSARIIGGHRYIWIDILCLDQREKNEDEIARMREYYANASGCLVWLDNGGTTGAVQWTSVLKAIEEVNKFFKMDRSGVSTISAAQMMRDGIGEINLSGSEAYSWVKKIVAIEKCPWFHRIWTMQEAVIPDSLYLCTPERYMCGGAPLFQLISICGMVAQLLMEAGSPAGVAVNHELQKSEIWKILRLRQLYRKNAIGYWHLFQTTRNRQCKIEQDKVFGLIGLVHGRVPKIDYSRSLKDLYVDLWRSSIELGDFSAIQYLGDGHTPIEPDIHCLPNIISAGAPKVAESHGFNILPNGINLEGVGITTVTRVWSIVTYGSLQAWRSPAFLDLTKSDHVDIAKAFGVSGDTIAGGLCPGAFAAISGLNPLAPDLLSAFGPAFEEKYLTVVPQGTLMWTKSGFLMQASEDNAFVVIWTASSPNEPMLAVVTERVEGTVVVVTPSSYVDTPGEGCILCAVNPDGSGRKIGLGIGKKVKATSKATFRMV